MRGVILAAVVGGVSAMPASASAQTAPVVVASVDGDVDAQRLNALMQEAAGGARTARMAAGWTNVGLGVAEIATGAVVLAALHDSVLNPILPIELFITGGLSAVFALPAFLIKSDMEKLASRSARDLADPGTPVNERVARAVGGLRTVADQEERTRVFTLVASGLIFVACGAGIALVYAAPLTADYRAGFATAFGVLAGIDVVLIVETILNRPAGRALDAWERGHTPSALRVRPVLSAAGVGLAGTF